MTYSNSLETGDKSVGEEEFGRPDGMKTDKGDLAQGGKRVWSPEDVNESKLNITDVS